MDVEIIHSDNAYVTDRIASNEKLIALTRKNADFIEAVVKLDSNYAKDFDMTNKESTAYIFNEMQNGGSFEECVSNVIAEIDKTNSTHLEAALDGRKTMAKSVCSICHSVDDLKTELQKDFLAQNRNHILAVLTDKIKAKNKDGFRYNLSFASKFCSYASEFLKIDKRYSKYDNIVARALPTYSKIYLGKEESAGAFLIQQYRTAEGLHYRLDVYEKYATCIESILAKLKNDGIEISKDELDHIIWYSFK